MGARTHRHTRAILQGAHPPQACKLPPEPTCDQHTGRTHEALSHAPPGPIMRFARHSLAACPVGCTPSTLVTAVQSPEKLGCELMKRGNETPALSVETIKADGKLHGVHTATLSCFRERAVERRINSCWWLQRCCGRHRCPDSSVSPLRLHRRANRLKSTGPGRGKGRRGAGNGTETVVRAGMNDHG